MTNCCFTSWTVFKTKLQMMLYCLQKLRLNARDWLLHWIPATPVKLWFFFALSYMLHPSSFLLFYPASFQSTYIVLFVCVNVLCRIFSIATLGGLHPSVQPWWIGLQQQGGIGTYNMWFRKETESACSNAKMHVKAKYTVVEYHIAPKV